MVAATSPPARPAVTADQVRLRPLSLSDKERVRRWMADPGVVQFTVLVPSPECAPSVPYGAEAADKYLRALVRDPTRRSFAIEVDGAHVGNVGLKDIDVEQRRCECFVEIGERSVRGRGVAKRALAEVLDIALFALELVEVDLGVFEFNDSAIQLYRRLGFEFAGTYGRHWADGRYWLVRRMRIDQDRWAFCRDELDAPRAGA